MSKYFGYVIKVLSVVVFVAAAAAIVFACVKLAPSDEVAKVLGVLGISVAGVRKAVRIVGIVLLLIMLLLCAYGYTYGDSMVASLEANRKAGNLEHEVAELREQLNRMEYALAEIRKDVAVGPYPRR